MASTNKRTEANRRNARRSTGPKSDAGKHRVRRNGLSHGLTNNALLLDDEDKSAYDALVASTVADLGPRSERERVLAVNVANTIWRRDRVYRVEAGFLNVQARTLIEAREEIRTHAEAAAHVLSEPERAASARLLLRYITTAERACNRAVDDFFAVRYETLNSQLREAELTDQLEKRAAESMMARLEAEEARDRARFASLFEDETPDLTATDLSGLDGQEYEQTSDEPADFDAPWPAGQPAHIRPQPVPPPDVPDEPSRPEPSRSTATQHVAAQPSAGTDAPPHTQANHAEPPSPESESAAAPKPGTHRPTTRADLETMSPGVAEAYRWFARHGGLPDHIAKEILK